MSYAAHVDNIGFIGEYDTHDEAIQALEETILLSTRAGTFGFVTDDEGNVTDVGTDNVLQEQHTP